MGMSDKGVLAVCVEVDHVLAGEGVRPQLSLGGGDFLAGQATGLVGVDLHRAPVRVDARGGVLIQFAEEVVATARRADEDAACRSSVRELLVRQCRSDGVAPLLGVDLGNLVDDGEVETLTPKSVGLLPTFQ